jgi:hypothetical protein
MFLNGLQRERRFSCPCCGDSPEVLILDGKVIRIEAARLHPNFAPITAFADRADVAPPHPRAHNRQDRAGISNCTEGATTAVVRSNLLALAARVRESNITTPLGYVTPILDADIPTLLWDMPAHFTGVTQLICAIAALTTGLPHGMTDGRELCTGNMIMAAYNSAQQSPVTHEERICLKKFLCALASSSPVCSYFCQEAVDIIRPLLGNMHARDIPNSHAFKLASPLLHGVWHIFHERQLHMHFGIPVWVSFWQRLCDISEKCHTGFDGGPTLIGPQLPPSCNGSFVESGTCTGMLHVRDREKCEMDTQAHTHTTESTGCRHAFTMSNKKTGGVFTIFCPHGICLGFFMLPQAEGRSEIYSFIMKHFVVAPKLIIYDFACALEEYFLNRAPAFVKYTRFLIDRLHFFNHTTCADGYCLSAYEQYNYINSQIAEQGNSRLTDIQDAASQMTQEHFMQNFEFFMSCWNDRKMKGLDAQTRFMDIVNGTN